VHLGTILPGRAVRALKSDVRGSTQKAQRRLHLLYMGVFIERFPLAAS